MIKKLYECGGFDYHRFIMGQTKALSLSMDEALVLIKILDDYPQNKSISIDQMTSYFNVTEKRLAEILGTLMERGFYDMYVVYDENGLGNEVISLDGFFNKVKAILETKSQDSKDELFLANKWLAEKMNRILTGQEIEIISSLIIEDKHTLDELKKACESIEKKNRMITIKGIAQALATKDVEVNVRPRSKVAKDFMNQIK